MKSKFCVIGPKTIELPPRKFWNDSGSAYPRGVPRGWKDTEAEAVAHGKDMIRRRGRFGNSVELYVVEVKQVLIPQGFPVDVVSPDSFEPGPE